MSLPAPSIVDIPAHAFTSMHRGPAARSLPVCGDHAMRGRNGAGSHMSLLDDIERDAEESNRRRAIGDAAIRARAQLDRERTRGVLERVERQLRRVARALNAAASPVRVRYEVPEVGELGPLQQGSYQVIKDPETEHTLRFHFVCLGEQPVKAVFASEAAARERERACVEAGLICRRIDHGGQRRALVLEPRVPVSLQFHAEGGGLRLRTRNFFDIQVRSYALAPQRVDEEFLEALLEVVMRRGNRLAELTGDRLEESSRSVLRKELARHERRRAAEVGGALGRWLFPVTEALRRWILRQ
jgi:hypothetical protein